MENIFYVYLHRRKTDNKVFYVGKGKGYRATSRHGRSDWWNKVVRKHGLEVEIVFDNLSEEDAYQCEKDTILEFKYFDHPLVNLTDGGEGARGCRRSKETRQRMSQAKKGIKFSDETKAKISISLKGFEFSEERKLNIKTGIDKKRREGAKTYTFIQNNTGEIFNGTRYDLADETGITPQELRYLFKSKPNKTVKGWGILYANETEEKIEEY